MDEYKEKYEALVNFLKSLIDEAADNEEYDDNMDNLYSHLKEIGEIP
jgi:hypothetical protein